MKRNKHKEREYRYVPLWEVISLLCYYEFQKKEKLDKKFVPQFLDIMADIRTKLRFAFKDYVRIPGPTAKDWTRIEAIGRETCQINFSHITR